MKTPPLIEYIPCTDDEQRLPEILRFIRAYVPIYEDADPNDLTGWTFLRQLADLEEERADCFFDPSLAIASDETLQAAVREIKTHLDYIESFGECILRELERRQGEESEK